MYRANHVNFYHSNKYFQWNDIEISDSNSIKYRVSIFKLISWFMPLHRLIMRLSLLMKALPKGCSCFSHFRHILPSLYLILSNSKTFVILLIIRGGHANLFWGSESEPESWLFLGSEPPNSEPNFENFDANICSEHYSRTLESFQNKQSES